MFPLTTMFTLWLVPVITFFIGAGIFSLVRQFRM